MMKHFRLVLLSLLGLLATTAARAEQFSVALFTKTAGWHHESILQGVEAIRNLGELHDFKVFWSEDPTRIFKDEELKKYKAVIFLSTTGDVLNDEQQALVHQDGGAHVPHPSPGADRDHEGRGLQLPRHGSLPEALPRNRGVVRV